ncbi:DUF6314 family protein [Kushneria aurantia]|uniref:DUF6314 family protein n=1 Tax=Kushneria aurantia TaxID=504092 RepID=A0ABV6G2U9_9GAMM|nr:DUF6314 family protein [Kushneria aurantia]
MTSSQPEKIFELTAIIRLRQRLAATRALTFSATPGARSSTDWAGRGYGEVQIKDDGTSVRFHEQGTFQHASGREMPFRNVYRFDIAERRLSLYHERFGATRAVFLFDMAPMAEDRFESLAPHLCVRDLYSGALHIDGTGFDLIWSIEGPRKQERIHYRYTP